MKTYKAYVFNKDEKRYEIIESEYNRKSDFIRDLRANGYRVNPSHVKTSDVFDYILNYTNGNWWDWKEIKSIPVK